MGDVHVGVPPLLAQAHSVQCMCGRKAGRGRFTASSTLLWLEGLLLLQVMNQTHACGRGPLQIVTGPHVAARLVKQPAAMQVGSYVARDMHHTAESGV